MKLELRTAGSCVHPEHIVLRTRSLRPMDFPAGYAILEHPKEGLSLFDTGYGDAFFEATQRFPERAYRWITPVTFDPTMSARAAVEKRGAKASDVRRVIVSHFHGDHVGALRDFPRAEFVFLPSAAAAVRSRSRLGGLLKGFLPALLPQDFSDRARPLRGEEVLLPDDCAPFRHGIDVFGDRSAIAVALPGHARGQLGLVVQADDARYFLVGDACWTSRSYRGPVEPHPIARLIIDDSREYRATLQAIHALHRRTSDLRIVPSHCTEALGRYGVARGHGYDPGHDEGQSLADKYAASV
ncbi:MAG: MBL fold metallo-hydrolase [Myxococcota bacterium]